MFAYATLFNKPLANWDVSNVTNMQNMFWAATNFNQDISNWDVSKVEDMRGMFAFAESFCQNLNKWQVNDNTKTGEMFYNLLSIITPPAWYKK